MKYSDLTLKQKLIFKLWNPDTTLNAIQDYVENNVLDFIEMCDVNGNRVDIETNVHYGSDDYDTINLIVFGKQYDRWTRTFGTYQINTFQTIIGSQKGERVNIPSSDGSKGLDYTEVCTFDRSEMLKTLDKVIKIRDQFKKAGVFKLYSQTMHQMAKNVDQQFEVITNLKIEKWFYDRVNGLRDNEGLTAKGRRALAKR